MGARKGAGLKVPAGISRESIWDQGTSQFLPVAPWGCIGKQGDSFGEDIVIKLCKLDCDEEWPEKVTLTCSTVLALMLLKRTGVVEVVGTEQILNREEQEDMQLLTMSPHPSSLGNEILSLFLAKLGESNNLFSGLLWCRQWGRKGCQYLYLFLL